MQRKKNDKKWVEELKSIFFSTSLVIRQMQSKTTVRFHCIPVRTAAIRKTDHIRSRKGSGKLELSDAASGIYNGTHNI